MGYHYLWWIPSVIVFNLIYAWLSVKNSQDTGWGWFIVIYAFGFIQLWALVSKVTPKEYMVFNAILYDLLMLFAFQTGLICLGMAKGFNYMHWIGLAFCLTGFTIFRIGDLS